MKTKRNRVRRIRWERLLAGMLCLCMMLSVFEQPSAVKAQTGPKMTIYLYLWHTDDAIGTLSQTYEMTENPVSGKLPVVAPATYNGEKFTAFSVSTGQSAIESFGTDETNPTAYVKYSPLIQTVKINVFYSINQDNAGIEFGGTEAFIDVNDPEIDTVGNVNKQDYYNKIEKSTDGVGAEETVEIYNTSAGLHTDKTASVSDIAKSLDKTEEGNSPRTFDVELESWFAGNNLADVGLVLDASGSMAWTVDDLDKDNQVVNINDCKELEITDEDPRWDSDTNTLWLTQEEVDKILIKTKTDNSLLSYGDYEYYVFDGRDSASEYVPLGYWDGKGTLGDGLIGYYPFDGTLENKALEGNSAWFIGKAEDGESGKIFSQDELDETKKPSKENIYTNNGARSGKDNNKCLIVYDDTTDDKGITKNGNVLLDQTLSGDNFTISFAVKSTTTINSNPKNRPLSDIMYIGPVDKEYTENDHYRIYRDGGSSTNRVKVDKKIESYTDGTRILGDILSINSVFNKTGTEWKVLTFVCDNGQIQVYLDGMAATAGKDDNVEATLEDFFNKEAQHIIIGGADPYGPCSLYLDELYIYDRALSDEEVKSLSAITKGGNGDKIAVAQIEENGEMRNLAAVDHGDKLGAAKLAGWYYVNSASDIYKSKNKNDDIHDWNTAKQFKPLIETMKIDGTIENQTDTLPPGSKFTVGENKSS